LTATLGYSINHMLTRCLENNPDDEQLPGLMTNFTKIPLTVAKIWKDRGYYLCVRCHNPLFHEDNFL